jgi:hypothetical protein
MQKLLVEIELNKLFIEISTETKWFTWWRNANDLFGNKKQNDEFVEKSQNDLAEET